jgi:hypothetical protein
MYATAAEWVASIPDELTLREGLVFVDQALADARQAVDETRARFTGTVPPPPWPMHPELETAVRTMEGGRKMLATGIDLGYGDRSYKKTEGQAAAVVKGGLKLYAEVAQMRKNMEGVTAADIPKVTATVINKMGGAAKAILGSGQVGGFIALAVVLYAMHTMGDE